MKNWFDEAVIEVVSGRGGNGCESYHHRRDRKKEPDGGNGGRGGDVWVEADSNVTGLIHFKFNQHFQAEDGASGGSNQKAGRSGKDLIIKVPCGTTITNADNNLRIRDLKDPDDQVMIAKGGRGGAGNHTGKEAKHGAAGTSFRIRLDFRVKANIVLVGTPGSGKSLLLHKLTNAHIEDKTYPFSTRAPHLGVYENQDYSKVVLCELPSLMKGSSEGRGLGNRYLKHLDRAEVIFLVMEPKSDFAPDLNTAYNLLREEIGHYEEDYLKMPMVGIVNKSDLIESEEERKKMEKTAEKWKVPVFFVSAKTGEGLDRLMKSMQGGSFYV